MALIGPTTAPMRLRTIFPGIFTVLLVLGIITAAFQSPSRTKRLPDGRVVKLEAATFGKKHRFEYGPPKWKTWLASNIPKLKPLLHLGPTWSGSSNSSSEESLKCWFTVRDGGGRFQENAWDRFAAIDEHGCHFVSRPDGGGSSKAEGFAFTRASLDSFPRRHRTFKLLGYLKDTPAPVTFEVANPEIRTSSTWNPETTPIVRNSNEMTFTFTAFTNGTNGVVFPQFDVSRFGEPATNWYARMIGYTDAAGNSGSFLCTNERAWKMNVLFSRRWDAKYDQEEVTQLTNIALPRSGEYVPLSRTSIWAGIIGRTLAMAGPGFYVISNGTIATARPLSSNKERNRVSSTFSSGMRSITSASRYPVIVLDYSGTMKADRSFMIRGVDNTGRAFLGEDWAGDRDMRFYSLPVASNATSVTLEFILHRTYQAEFMVKPPVLVYRSPD